MIRHKWILGVRNKLAEFFIQCDSCAAIDGAEMTRTEREELKELLQKVIEYIDKKLNFK